MIGNIVYLVMYLLTEFINYLMAYVLVFQAEIQKNIGKWLVGLGTIFVVHYVVMCRLGPIASSSVSFITMIIIPTFLLDRRERKYYLLYPFIVIGTSVIAVSVSFLWALVVDIPEYLVLESPVVTIACQCVPMLMMLVLYIYRKIKGCPVLKVQLGLKQYLLFYIGLVCTYLMLMPMQLISEGDITEKNINICGFAISVACIVFILVVLWQGIIVYREIELKERNKMYEEYMELQADHYHQLMEQDEKMRRFRHDVNAHIAVLRSYCTGENNEELQEYLNNMIENSAIYEVENYTGNRGVDAAIRQLIQEAKGKQIGIEIRGSIPDKTRVSVYDLCTILSNLLKNAIEACEKIEAGGGRYIKLNLASYNEEIFITIKNTISHEVLMENGCLPTSKSDRKNHGLGSGNVKKTVEKYHGSLEYTCEDGWFFVEIGV